MVITRRLFKISNLSAGFGLLAVLCLPSHLAAQTGKSLASFDNICLAEARRAEARHGIPTGLMQSIARVESGRKMVTGEYIPWAWTLNDQGEGLFFDDRDSALAYLQDAVAHPGHSVDVGCMQVNTKWHADGFLDIADMLDPVHNASYAAGFLLDLHAAHESWDEAVKHYHSAEPRKNVAYHRRVLAELERFMTDTLPESAQTASSEPASSEMASSEMASSEMASSPSDDGVVQTAAIASAATQAAALAATGDADDVLSTDLLSAPEIGSTDQAAVPSMPAAQPDVILPDGAESVAAPRAKAPLVEAPLTAGAPSIVASQPDMSPQPGNNAPAAAAVDDPLLAKQPNLVPHRSRVEHFRRLLAQQAG